MEKALCGRGYWGDSALLLPQISVCYFSSIFSKLDVYKRQVQVGIRSGAAKDFKEQLENGIRLDKAHYLRIFPVWFSFKGNIAVHLSTGKAAAICARCV